MAHTPSCVLYQFQKTRASRGELVENMTQNSKMQTQKEESLDESDNRLSYSEKSDSM